MRNDKKSQPKRFYAFIFGLVAFAFFCVMVMLFLYFYNFHGEFGDQDLFAKFGDFIGGVLNPIFSFLTVILLVVSIAIQRQELHKVTDELELARNVHQSSVNMRHYEYLVNHMSDDESAYNAASDLFRSSLDEEITLNLSPITYLTKDTYRIMEILANEELMQLALTHGYMTFISHSPSVKTKYIQNFSEKLEILNSPLKTMIVDVKRIKKLNCPSWRAEAVLQVGHDLIKEYILTEHLGPTYRTNIMQYLADAPEFVSTYLDYPEEPNND